MTFGEAVASVFSKYATFEGRARRSEFWYFELFNFIVLFALSFLSAYASLFGILEGLYSLAVLVPTLAVCWRRLHDIGKSGAYWFFNFIPLVGSIILLVWFCQDSQPGSNQYGLNPKGNQY